MFTLPYQFKTNGHLNTAFMHQLSYSNGIGDAACKVTVMDGGYFPSPIDSQYNGKWGMLRGSSVWLPWHSFKVALARRDLPEFVALVNDHKSRYKTRRAWRRNRRYFTDKSLAQLITFDQQVRS